MSLATEPTTETKLYCTNHPQTETLLRCNKCGRPMCLKCVQRTPVGYRCKECLGEQRAGYYTATPLDYALTGILALVLGGIAVLLMNFINLGLFSIIIAIFAGPFAGGIISEVIRRVTAKRRGRYIALTAAIAIALAAFILFLLPVLPFLFSGNARAMSAVLMNWGFWIFIALTISTTFARLRA